MTRLRGAALLALVALAGAGLGAAGMLVADGARGGDGVRRYLLAHPEVIPEAMQRLRDRETGKVIAAGRPAIETPVGSAWAGNPKGDVTLVEYYDYNCGYCRASRPTVAALLAVDPGLRVVYRELPVLAPSSHAAALASLAAARQGKFAAFHDALFAGGQVTDASIAAAATAAGVAVPRTPTSADESEIAANMKSAGDLGIGGTPGWVIGDRVMIGAQTLDALRDAAAAARARNG